MYEIKQHLINCADCGLTTICGLHYSSKTKKITIYSAGDSRLYGFHKDHKDQNNKKFTQLTRDDSTAPLLMKCFGISELEAHRQRKLTNAMGQRFFQLRETVIDADKYSAFILASDGAYLSLSTEDWTELERMASASQIDSIGMLEIIKTAIRRKADDNSTVIILLDGDK